MSSKGEFALIEMIKRSLAANKHIEPDFASITIESGDDAAGLQARGLIDSLVDSPNGGSGPTWLWTIDTFTEGIHFKCDWAKPGEIGMRALAASASDVIAMGARPAACLVALSAPSTIDITWVRELSEGMASQANELGARLIGGDVSESPTLSLCVSVLGVLPPNRAPVTRGGAKPGDVVAVCGDLGSAAAGLALLNSGKITDQFESLVAAYRCPAISPLTGERAAGAGATAMIDVSDGLLADLGHIAEQSSVQINVDSESLPVPPGVQELGIELGQDSFKWVLTGGDSHAIVATFPPSVTLPEGFKKIGEVRSLVSNDSRNRPKNDAVTVDDMSYDQPTGYQHFI
jgi:thiamine-monophosphate kinase